MNNMGPAMNMGNNAMEMENNAMGMENNAMGMENNAMGMGNNAMNMGPAMDMGNNMNMRNNMNMVCNSPAMEEFSNLKWNGINVDAILRAIFFGCIFYLLSLPEVYKVTKKCCKGVDGVLLHSIVFAVIYFIIKQFI